MLRITAQNTHIWTGDQPSPAAAAAEQVSISGQALVFVVRTTKHSFLDRAGGLTYLAFFGAQVSQTKCLLQHACQTIAEVLLAR